MREILFKAKRLDNGEWVEGNIVAVPEDADFMPGAYILPRLVSARADPPTKGIMLGGFFEVAPSTVCQYTGPKDKNGKRIFEGDNVYDPHENSIYTVEWNENNAIFQMAHDWHRRSVETAYYCEIIGNIYDGEGDNDSRKKLPALRRRSNAL